MDKKQEKSPLNYDEIINMFETTENLNGRINQKDIERIIGEPRTIVIEHGAILKQYFSVKAKDGFFLIRYMIENNKYIIYPDDSRRFTKDDLKSLYKNINRYKDMISNIEEILETNKLRLINIDKE